jgi:hypothetical protein
LSIIDNALPFLGQVVLVALLLCVALGSLNNVERKRRHLFFILLAIGLFLPVYGLTFAEWLRSVIGDLSILTLIIFSDSLLRRLFKRSFLDLSSRNTLLLGVGILGLVFYPLALGLGSFDPYQLGFTPLILPLVLGLISVYAWFAGKRIIAIILLLPLIAFNLRLLESVNLWDYLMDPILLIYALIQLAMQWIKLYISSRDL